MWASISAGGWSSSDPGRLARLVVFFVLIALSFSLSSRPAFAAPPAAPQHPAAFQPAGPQPAGPQPAGPQHVEVLPPPVPIPEPPSVPILAPRPVVDACLGKPVTGVDTELVGEAWGLTRLPQVTTVRPGEPFREETARRALEELLGKGGQFARGRVTLRPEGAGCRLVVQVAVRKLIESLRVEMNGVRVDRDELLREGDLAEGGEFVGADMADKQDRMETLLARHGYPDANVSLEAKNADDPVRVNIVLHLEDTAPRILGRRVFYVYDARAEALAATNETYRVKAGDRADEAALETADTQLEARLRARGYHHADVSHDVVEADGVIVLRVRVDAGKQYEPRFEGNDHYDDEALRGALGLDVEADLSPVHLMDKLREFYQKRGYYDVSVTYEDRGTARDAIHYLVFKISEGQRVTVTARTYPCLREEDVRKLTEGGPTSVSDIGREIDSYNEEELPGADILKSPDPRSTDALIGPTEGTGTRDAPVDLEPDATYVPDTYQRAVEHVQELYRHEGFLHAQVGPVQIVRRRCDPRSPANRCIPVPLPPQPPEACTYDITNLPLPVAPIPQSLSCVPDPLHGVSCEPRMVLRIPVKLGPRTTLYDVGFTGAHAISERTLAQVAALPLGSPANTITLEEARRRLLDVYKEEGYAFADVKYTLDESLDHTRARVLFEITEGEQVIVRRIVVQGNDLTREGVIRRRIALVEGAPYRTSLIRKTQERIATLNVFSGVEVALADPYVPAKYKTVIITVAEVVPKFVEIRPGFSTGEGIRLTTEIGDRNLFGTAIAVSARVQASYLPDAFILDDDVRANFKQLERDQGFLARVAGRLTLRGEFPEIGLGPLVRGAIDGVYSHALQRDFVLTKAAVIPSATYKPIRPITIVFSPTAEQNTARIFNELTVDQYLRNLQAAGGGGDLARLLRVPDGTSVAFSERVVVTWDRRDNSFAAHSGTYFASGIEHVDWHTVTPGANTPKDAANQDGHFFKFTETFAGYIPFGRRITLAMEIRLGINIQTVPHSTTYPDRLFFLGGVESMRGYAQDSLVPQDLADRIEHDTKLTLPSGTLPSGAIPFSANNIAIRGGNLMFNPKAELRIPLRGPLETALFTDVGNLWVDPTYPFDTGKFPMRVSVGAGLRFQTPIGPLVFDYGINLTRRSAYEDFGAFHFAIGLF